ncbi:MAG: PilZ domain-containing protein [Candidatus Omnitrophica bacterium]|nr:PilZ domain-containing protein [Candidatus Omnitrophota bacterium]
MSQEKHGIDKRRYPRVNKNLPIKIKNRDFDIVTETKNISCIGAYCQTDKYIPPFTKIKATLLLPSTTKTANRYINCEGTIVRTEKDNNSSEPQYNIAIYFNQISKTSILKIDHFIKNHLIYG